MRIFVVVFTCLCVKLEPSFAAQDQIQLVNNVYNKLLIAINPQVPENPKLIDEIKTVMTAASDVLYVATKNRARFGKIDILVPATWTKGNYSQTATLNYGQSDIRVAPPTDSKKNEPFTVQNGKCGEFGDYMHVTPNFLTSLSTEDFGPKEKVIVHEWGHLRWGVFDEYPLANNPTFYLDPDEKVQATRCPLSMEGLNMDIDFDTGVAKACTIVPETRLPDKNCRFISTGVKGSVSMMSHVYLRKVIHFCHDDPDDPNNQHNPEAPNEQNKQCNLQSTWSVIMRSIDFANNANPPKDGLKNQPEFEVHIPRSSRNFAMVLDTSGSMYGTRMDEMRQAARAFINQALPIGDKVAIIQFSFFATTTQPLVKVSTPADKLSLVNSIPSNAFGSTCIGCGLQTAVQALTADDSKSCGEIIVFTDGEENSAPFVRDVAGLVKEKKCRVHAIFFTAVGNEALRNLSVETEGKWFFGLDNNVNRLIGAFTNIAKKNDGSDKSGASQIVRTKFDMKANTPQSGDVNIDKLLGNETIFQFNWLATAPTVILTAPNGCTFSTYLVKEPKSCPGQPIVVVNEQFKTTEFPVPGTAQFGKWTYQITTSSDDTVTVIVTSNPNKQNVKPIVIDSTFSQAKKGDPAIATATVTRGGNRILNLKVEAEIQDPNGKLYKETLLDNGVAADAKKNDGTYSKYFVASVPGRYSMEVTVTKDGEKQVTKETVGQVSRAPFIYAKYEEGELRLNPKGLENEPKPAVEANTDDIGNFTRIDSSGGFEVDAADLPAPGVDTQPPNEVRDLTVRQNDLDDSSKGIVVEFTAPGDDADEGRAARYEICYTVSYGRQLQRNLSHAVCVNTTLEGNLTSPVGSGNRERFVLRPPESDADFKGTIRMVFYVRAYDDAGNSADRSNIVPLRFFSEPPILRQPEPVTIRVATTEPQPTTTEPQPTTTTTTTAPTTKTTTTTTTPTTTTPTTTTPTTTTTTATTTTATTTTAPTTTTTTAAPPTATTTLPTAAPGEMYCWTCHNKNSSEDCNKNGQMVLCNKGERSCETEVRVFNFGTGMKITKKCKQPHACRNSEKQNPNECKVNEYVNSVCRCCCESDGCNLATTCPLN